MGSLELKKTKRKALIWLCLSLLFLFFTFLSGWIIKFYRDYQNLSYYDLIGNKTSNANILKERGFPFSFLIISDTHNSKVAENLLKLAMNKGDVSFLIHIGDFVNSPNLLDHRFFQMNLSMEIKPSFPIFLAPGNHDIEYFPSNRGKNHHRVTPEVFDSIYGSRSFHFIFNNCLFILCEIDPRRPTDYLDYLHDTLSQKGEGRRYIFIFIHYPPRRLVRDKGKSSLPDEEKFFELVESFKVHTCFFGHYHGYRRISTKGVQMIVLGGGGGGLKSWQPEWGKFHHLLKINVHEDMISEDMLIFKDNNIDVAREVKRFAFFNLFPIIEHRAWSLYMVSLLFLVWGTYFMKRFFFYSLKKENREGPEKS